MEIRMKLHEPSDGNYVARMTKQELIEFADVKMMDRRQVLQWAHRVRRQLAKDALRPHP